MRYQHEDERVFHSGGRDKRRRFTETDRSEAYARQNGRCAMEPSSIPGCTKALLPGFHMHHVVEHVGGGVTTLGNDLAVCPTCHKFAATAQREDFIPREWQDEAFGLLLPKLWGEALNDAGEATFGPGFATLMAAPGAGKTKMALWLATNVMARGGAERLVVFAPRLRIIDQWVRNAKEFGLNLEVAGTTAGVIEDLENSDGIVLSYQALINDKSRNAAMMMSKVRPTMFILDEAHHLGALADTAVMSAWGFGLHGVIGSPEKPKAPVLNLSGTLWRTDPRQMIPTINYRQTPDGLMESVSDYSVDCNRLINEGDLRPVALMAYSVSVQQVHGVDFVAEISDGEVLDKSVDLTDRTGSLSTISRSHLRDLYRDMDGFVEPMLRETLRWMQHQSQALNWHPAKGLIVCADQAMAKKVYDRLIKLHGDENVMLAISDIKSHDHEFNRFHNRKGPAILVTVDMAKEGFDEPDISVLTYLSTTSTQQAINQTVARAMRVSDKERELRAGGEDYRLPARVIIPDEPELRHLFSRVLAGPMGLIVDDNICEECDSKPCVCWKPPPPDVCKTCLSKPCICPCKGCYQDKDECICARCGKCGRKMVACACSPFSAIAEAGTFMNTGIAYNDKDISLDLYGTVEAACREYAVPVAYAAGIAAMQERINTIHHDASPEAEQEQSGDNPTA